MTYRVTKTYGHELGLSACFRQPRATSHCRFLHGYALGFKLVLEASRLDVNGWVKDFGSLKPFKQWLCDTFDHKLLVATDDPARDILYALRGASPPGHDQLADVLVLPRVGCESFAQMAWYKVQELITEEELDRKVRLIEVECREHAGNAASYMGTN